MIGLQELVERVEKRTPQYSNVCSWADDESFFDFIMANGYDGVIDGRELCERAADWLGEHRLRFIGLAIGHMAIEARQNARA